MERYIRLFSGEQVIAVAQATQSGYNTPEYFRESEETVMIEVS